MKNKFIILISGAMLFALTSCIEDFMVIRGNGISTTVTHRTAPFYKLENSTSIDVIYKTADTTGITIRADENLIDNILTETYDNTLEIKFTPDDHHPDFNVKPLITITSPRLEKAIISGSGAFLADRMTGDDVTIKISGSGDISADNVLCKNLSVMNTGSGNINIKDCQTDFSDIFLTGSGNLNTSGQSADNSFKITGSGTLHGEDYLLETASIIISGSGNAFTNIEQKLNAIISGSGNIYLKGNPSISKTISGSGRIISYK
jgi:hypothetical protein